MMQLMKKILLMLMMILLMLMLMMLMEMMLMLMLMMMMLMMMLLMKMMKLLWLKNKVTTNYILPDHDDEELEIENDKIAWIKPIFILIFTSFIFNVFFDSINIVTFITVTVCKPNNLRNVFYY